MFKFVEQWALTRLLERFVKSLSIEEGILTKIWEEHKDEIYENVCEAIKNTIIKIIKKALEQKGIKFLDNSNN